MTYFKPTDSKCPKCGWFLVEKEDKQRGAYKSCINPSCDYLHTKETDEHEKEDGHHHDADATDTAGAGSPDKETDGQSA